MDAAHRAKPAVAVQAIEYELAERVALSAAGRRYPSQRSCEAAKQVLLDDGERRRMAMAEQGATIIGQPEISCVPLSANAQMCGRYPNTQTWTELHAAMRNFVGEPIQAAVNLEPREQIRPTNDAPIVRMIDGAPNVGNARWWLVPWFHKGALKDWKATTFNARAETVATSRAYRDSFKRRRCLVVADGWYNGAARAKATRSESNRGCSKRVTGSRSCSRVYGIGATLQT